MNLHKFDLTSAEFKRDPFPTLAHMREAGPVIRMKLPFIGRTWVATTYAACDRVLRDSESFVREGRNAGRRGPPGLKWWMPKLIRVLGENMLAKDEPDHRRLRGLVEQAFLRQSVEEMRPRIEALANRFLDELEQAGATKSGKVDFLTHFARPLPLAVICEMLGLPEEDRGQFMSWASRLMRVTSWWGVFHALFGLRHLGRYIKGQIEQCRRSPRPGMISALVAAEQEGDRLSEEELLAMCFLLLFAGHETTVHLLSTGVLTLLDHPDQLAKLSADWSLAPGAVDEILRYASPVQMTKPRMAAQDMELFGQTLKRGDYIIPFLAAANADPARFDQPETFDIARHPNPQLTFGGGIHICLGLKLARAEAAIALEGLFTRFPELQLAIDYEELPWIKRIGMRAVTEMPVRLQAGVTTPVSSDSATSPPQAASV